MAMAGGLCGSRDQYGRRAKLSMAVLRLRAYLPELGFGLEYGPEEEPKSVLC